MVFYNYLGISFYIKNNYIFSLLDYISKSMGKGFSTGVKLSEDNHLNL